MKKIAFGSFPLNEMRADDRKCLDRYLIKTFSDNISISDAIRNMAVTKNLMYITPDNLMKKWMSGNQDDVNRDNDRTSNDVYEKALKRAFYVLKEFYSKIKDAPFYKEFIYYPIYVEKIEYLDVIKKGADNNKGNNGNNGNNKNKDYDDKTDSVKTLMNYSFVILSNDLTKSLKIDEIRYDDNATLNFLFLFIEFFTSRSLNYYKPGEKPDRFNKSIHDFDKADYEFLVKLYQFIEQSGKDPIHMTIDLYKLLGLIKEASTGRSSSAAFSGRLRSTQDDFDTAALQKYKRLIKHNLFDLVKKRSQGNTDPMQYRNAFMDIMNVIFKAEGLSGLYAGVDSSADMGERQRYVYSSNKYREILNLAKELVAYNRLDCKNVIQNDPMDFDFKVESGDYTVETQSHVVSQRYQEFFKAYVTSIKGYIINIAQVFVQEMSLDKKINHTLDVQQKVFDSEMKKLVNRVYKLNIDKTDADKIASDAWVDAAAASPGSQAKKNFQTKALEAEKHSRGYVAALNTAQIEQDQRKTLYAILNANMDTIADKLQDKNEDLYKEIAAAVMSTLATDLTFVYDDGKRFFMNQDVAKGFINLSTQGQHNILEKQGFQSVVDKYADKSIFPPEDPKTGQINPDYMAAQLVKSLDDSFDVMASDTITAIADNILPALHNLISKSVKSDIGSTTPSVMPQYYEEGKVIHDMLQEMLSGLDKDKIIPVGFHEKLYKDIYRTRFQTNVLMNFKKLFRVREVSQKLAYEASVSQLHPLIRKLVGNGNRCQYFKSFILNYNTVEQLYNLKYLADTQKFLYGIENQPPRKLSSVMNKIKAVLFDFLGLGDNPVWLVSDSTVYLSMPDDLSLTNTSILSTIPKTELRDVCKIKASDYWKEGNLGAATKFDNIKLEKAKRAYKAATDELNKLNNKSGKHKNQNVIDKAQAKVDRLLDELNKVKLETKNYIPNAFLFNTEENDPAKAENQSLLTDAEKADLERNKQELRDKLLDLNPYDADAVDQMEADMNKPMRSHPFDFMDTDDAQGQPNAKPNDAESNESQAERLFRLRAELKQAEEEEAKKRQNPEGPRY